MKATATATQLKVADEAWIAAGLLHREQPGEDDFTVEQIVQRAKREAITPSLRPGVYVHVLQHCVANRPPNSGRYRMLFETSPGRRRLFRKGDSYHPEREAGKVAPRREDLPRGYEDLLRWYEGWSAAGAAQAAQSDPLLALRGSGQHLWAAEHSDDYVRRLREGWE